MCKRQAGGPKFRQQNALCFHKLCLWTLKSFHLTKMCCWYNMTSWLFKVRLLPCIEENSVSWSSSRNHQKINEKQNSNGNKLTSENYILLQLCYVLLSNLSVKMYSNQRKLQKIFWFLLSIVHLCNRKFLSSIHIFFLIVSFLPTDRKHVYICLSLASKFCYISIRYPVRSAFVQRCLFFHPKNELIERKLSSLRN